MSRECSHPTCGETCRREKKVKKTYQIKRTAVKSKPYKIRQFSKTRQKVNRSYTQKSKDFREENPLCAIHSPDCMGVTHGVHHTKGKATEELLMDEKHWLPACNPCNLYIETHSKWAIENGFKKSKYN